MTVDQIPLPFTAIRPLPPAPWPASDDDRDCSGSAPNRPRKNEPAREPSGWPRIFPGL